jgi:hypothetical protein
MGDGATKPVAILAATPWGWRDFGVFSVTGHEFQG